MGAHMSLVQTAQTLGTLGVTETTLKGIGKQAVRLLVCGCIARTLSKPHASLLRQYPLCDWLQGCRDQKAGGCTHRE